jgi:hypothetical protein
VALKRKARSDPGPRIIRVGWRSVIADDDLKSGLGERIDDELRQPFRVNDHRAVQVDRKIRTSIGPDFNWNRKPIEAMGFR